MSYRIEVETQVGQDGMVHVDIPDVEPGQGVRVVVEDTPIAAGQERVSGNPP
ncbi:hypothetical protein [Fimbriimonas ginsengisoli]|uniref:Uncharacterized protein n=1 Tax=Fimbriimonas ginsengisoli Gsoil 348 TaxID=661478 RepID=A0A068NU71_FIMGI|nr:hypothetical protein [Fimbriimonas ginsengisoli]AIE85149.1 hypothetical protein OP10G_1781 [Fimbriimonas ginsengisoli Gsoil 348]